MAATMILIIALFESLDLPAGAEGGVSVGVGAGGGVVGVTGGGGVVGGIVAVGVGIAGLLVALSTLFLALGLPPSLSLCFENPKENLPPPPPPLGSRFAIRSVRSLERVLGILNNNC